MNVSYVFLGIVLLVIAALSWIIYIPIFSDWWFGEIGGIVLLYYGLKGRGQSQQPYGSDVTYDSTLQ